MQIIFPQPKLIFLSFFLFGLLNNVLYVVILSAAVDLVGSSTPKAIVLLADIIPSFGIKVLAPFFISFVNYHVRVWTLVILSSVGMVMISLLPQGQIWAKVFGIGLASLSSGLGEVTFLQLTHYYERDKSISGFSSGTGGAGLFGSFAYLLMTNLAGIPIWIALLIFSFMPTGFLFAFYILLPQPNTLADPDYRPIDQAMATEQQPTWNSVELVSAHIKNTIAEIQPLFLPYMMPLCLVYIAEYVINQGISPTLLFPIENLPSWLFSSYRDIYVVYGFLYQSGVFISRSSVCFGVRVKNLYLIAVLQFVNVLITLYQSVYDAPFPLIWPLLILIFYEGLLGGLLYVNTFMSVSEEVPHDKREFSLGCVGISDTFGIMLAGCINWWLEPSLCNAQVLRGRYWCSNGSN